MFRLKDDLDSTFRSYLGFCISNETVFMHAHRRDYDGFIRWKRGRASSDAYISEEKFVIFKLLFFEMVGVSSSYGSISILDS